MLLDYCDKLVAPAYRDGFRMLFDYDYVRDRVVVGVVVALLIGFFVAAACGYMAGLIGTSASPISGIGILATIISSLVVYFIASENNLFATEAGVQFATAMAIFMTSVVIAIASISNDNLQDLKTGQLVGATPWRQQIALLLGSVAGAIAIAPVLNLLYQAYGFTGALPRAEMDPNAALSAPQATLMTTIAQGIFNASMDWNYILIGVGVGVVAIIVNLILKSTTASLTLPPLAVGMGIYLPPTLEVPLIIGSFLSYFVGRYLIARAKMRAGELAEYDVEQSNRRGVLFASGLIVGESLIGVIIAVIIVLSVTTGGGESPLELVGPQFESTAQWLGLLAFIFAGLYLVRRVVAFFDTFMEKRDGGYRNRYRFFVYCGVLYISHCNILETSCKKELSNSCTGSTCTRHYYRTFLTTGLRKIC